MLPFCSLKRYHGFEISSHRFYRPWGGFRESYKVVLSILVSVWGWIVCQNLHICSWLFYSFRGITGLGSGKKKRQQWSSVCLCERVKMSSHFILFVTDGEPEPADGKIMFRKPAKRSSEKLLDFNVSSSKKIKEGKKTEREATTSQSTAKQIKNSSLLSFDDEENDD